MTTDLRTILATKIRTALEADPETDPIHEALELGQLAVLVNQAGLSLTPLPEQEPPRMPAEVQRHKGLDVVFGGRAEIGARLRRRRATAPGHCEHGETSGRSAVAIGLRDPGRRHERHGSGEPVGGGGVGACRPGGEAAGDETFGGFGILVQRAAQALLGQRDERRGAPFPRLRHRRRRGTGCRRVPTPNASKARR